MICGLFAVTEVRMGAADTVGDSLLVFGLLTVNSEFVLAASCKLQAASCKLAMKWSISVAVAR